MLIKITHVTHPDSYHGYRNLMTHDASKRLKGRGLQLCSQRFKASTEKKRSFAGCKPVPAIEVPWFLIRCDLFKIRCTTYVGTKVRNMSKIIENHILRNKLIFIKIIIIFNQLVLNQVTEKSVLIKWVLPSTLPICSNRICQIAECLLALKGYN